MTTDELIMMQSLPLEIKIEKSKLRIREYVDKFGADGVYVSFSGGKDSVVLLHLVRSLFPDIVGVFSNTGLEFPEVVDFVKTFDNIEIVRPAKSFKQVIEEEGYPIVSKQVAMMVRRCTLPNCDENYSKRLHLEGIKKDGSKASHNSMLPKKWHKLVDAPFKVSDRCCYILKKNPLKEYGKRTDKHPIIGTLASEGGIRVTAYMETGCNSFKTGNIKSQPLGFWTEQDILQYIVLNNLEIPSVYGELNTDSEGKYYLDGRDRTGCIFCGFGCHLAKGKNNYQMLEESHPQLHDYCINKLGFGEVLDYIGVKYTNEE